MFYRLVAGAVNTGMSLTSELRQRIFAGAILRRPATTASLALADAVMAAVGAVLGPAPRDGSGDLHAALAELRIAVMREPRWWRMLATIIDETGFALDRQHIDAPRLRALAPHLAEAQAPRGAYAVHRDTWYANPPAQVNWWLALHDLEPGESFAFYPQFFATPIANDSALLDYEALVALHSRGIAPASVHAPDTRVRPPASAARRFRLARGELVLFSGAHLHGGMPVTSGRARFSLDFRTVDEDDVRAGRGGPLLDAACGGHAETDYVRLGGEWAATAPGVIAALLARIEVLDLDMSPAAGGSC
jgi:hypothetical protein